MTTGRWGKQHLINVLAMLCHGTVKAHREHRATPTLRCIIGTKCAGARLLALPSCLCSMLAQATRSKPRTDSLPNPPHHQNATNRLAVHFPRGDRIYSKYSFLGKLTRKQHLLSFFGREWKRLKSEIGNEIRSI